MVFTEPRFDLVRDVLRGAWIAHRRETAHLTIDLGRVLHAECPLQNLVDEVRWADTETARLLGDAGLQQWIELEIASWRSPVQQFQIWAASRDPWWMRRARPPCRIPDTERRALSTLQRCRFCRADKRSASTFSLAAGTLELLSPVLPAMVIGGSNPGRGSLSKNRGNPAERCSLQDWSP